MRFNVIGAGRLGKNLALSLLSRADCELVAVCNQSIQSAVDAVAELGAGLAVGSLTELPSVDVTFITAPDDGLAEIARSLRGVSGIVAHCSGALSSDVLTPLKRQGCLIASIHPLKAFRKNNTQSNAFKDCDCVIEGDELAVDLLTTLFFDMGANVLPILAAKKASYHAAAVMASNYLVTLAGCAVELLMDSGLTETQANSMTQGLMQSSLNNLKHSNHASEALTGPLSRGDIQTVHQHLQAIKNPSIDALYRTAGLATLPFTHLDDNVQDAFRTSLNE